MKPFSSFFMGGYECADHINRSGERVNMLEETEHLKRIEEDYKSLASMGITTVREGISWSAVETSPFVYDFSNVKKMMEAAEKFGIQQIWDLCHFGYPDGIFPTHPQFCDRFEALCEAFTFFYKANSNQPLLVVPINEISFLAWHSGDVRGTVPFAVNSGWDMKYHLCKAAIIGIRRIKALDPDAQIILVEPLVKIHGQATDDEDFIKTLNEHQFQAMDIISGTICPELGGSPALFDILGFNHYWDGQWLHGVTTLPWPEEFVEIRTAFSILLEGAFNRYQKPIFVSETGHFGVGRVHWIMEITSECLKAIENGVDLRGICIYPVTDRPDWDQLDRYSNCGIFDLDENKNRIRQQTYSEAIQLCIQQVEMYWESRMAVSLLA